MENIQKERYERRKTFAWCIICALICLIVGGLSSEFQTTSIREWYPTLAKSALTPPAYVFPTVWSILYTIMGVSIGLVLGAKNVNKSFAIIVFLAQLAVNFMWSVVFFGMRNPTLGLVDSIALLILVITYAFAANGISKVAAWLFAPYILWCAFATYLNFCIVILN